MTRLRRALVCALLSAALPAAAAAQTFETLGTRAAGFGGAFVAVADDASGVYWNPAGLASGAFFSLVVDRGTFEVKPDDPFAGSSRSAAIIALAAPPLGLGYYRLRRTTTRSALSSATAEPAVDRNTDTPAGIRVDSLITHHAGVTLVQSLSDVVAVGATLKLVRGIAAAGIASGSTREALLEADDLIGRASSTVDADVGIMASLGIVRAGVTIRNLREPSFEAAGSAGPLRLDRQARAGIAFLPLQDWLMAIDVDLTRQPDPLGDTRNLAAGLEGRVHPRVTVRGGLRFNTVESAGRRAVLTGGGTFAVFGSTFLDAQVTGGSGDGDRGWGIAGRVAF